MTYEPIDSPIGRRQALCTLASVATAVAGIGLLGIGTARADETPNVLGRESTPTVSADEAARTAEALAAEAREFAATRALVPEELEVGPWSIERVVGPRLGAIAVVMRTPDGQAFQVDLLRRDPAIAGIAETRHFSVFVSNSGDGSKATDELQARGAMVLAHQIRHRELTGAPPPVLLSFAERSNQFPLGEFGVLG